MRTLIRSVLFLLLVAISSAAFASSDIVVVVMDGPGEGFNDPAPRATVGGNNALTLGEQRLNAFKEAARIWGQTLDSNVQIRIQASFDPLTCTATSAVLGSAGAIQIFANGPLPQSNTFYHVALANKLTGVDLAPGLAGSSADDIAARFNSSIGTVPGCLTGSDWYYGLDGNHGTKIDLIAVLLHEFGHGLGFSSFANRTTGSFPLNIPGIFDRFTLDTTTGLTFADIGTDAARFSAMTKGRKIVWNGPTVTAAVPSVLFLGSPLLRVTSPPSISGAYDVGTAAFGPALTGSGVTGTVVAAVDPADAAGASTFDACSPLTNAAGSLSGRIAILNRGTCGFVVKVKNAQNAGAIAVLVADNAAGSPPAGLGGADATITIPSVRITQADGATIRANLAGGVTVTLLLDGSVRAGANTSGFVFLNTPDPLVPGSSVSHWDPLTFRNQLMEPAINGDLTHSVKPPEDLTLPQMRDIGWYPDVDLDVVPDSSDNCPNVANTNQLNSDGDAKGDVCDNCPFAANSNQANNDGDALGDVCDPDDDNDGILDTLDNCQFTANPNQANNDGDAQGDVCDTDDDNDGVMDTADNCPFTANSNQANNDGDAQGDVCDPDDDNDGILDTVDNCQFTANPNQANNDGDALGDVCDPDDDNDGVLDGVDNCQFTANANQANYDGDAQGDACDADDDNDGVPDATDVVDLSDLRPTVVIQSCDSGSPNVLFTDGSTLMDRIAALIATNPRNHGQFVSALTKLLNEAKDLGLITGAQKGAIDACAGQSSIGN